MPVERSALETLTIQEPCSLRWEQLEGDGSRRFCGQCARHVHDLSAMTAPEAEALLEASRGERLCVTYVHGPDGLPRTRAQARSARTGRPVRGPLAMLLRALWSPLLGAVALLPGCGRKEGEGRAPAPAPADRPELPEDELEMLRSLGGYCGQASDVGSEVVMGEVALERPVRLPERRAGHVAEDASRLR